MSLEVLLYVNGAGSGAAICPTMGTFAIARQCQHRGKPPAAKADAFVCIIAEGSGLDRAATLGLTQAQLESRGRIIFPGPRAGS
eukprot:519750-Pyramimonas_sp.AAC.1